MGDIGDTENYKSVQQGCIFFFKWRQGPIAYCDFSLLGQLGIRARGNLDDIYCHSFSVFVEVIAEPIST